MCLFVCLRLLVMSLKKTKSNSRSTKLKGLQKPATNTQISARNAESDDSDSSENIFSDDENQWNDTKRATVTDPTLDYFNIQKLVKYVKAGNTTATIVSLCCLKDYDLSISINRMVKDLF